MSLSPTRLYPTGDGLSPYEVALEAGQAQAKVLAELAAQVAALVIAREEDRQIIDELVAERDATRIPQLMTIPQAAALCSVSDDTLRSWTRLPDDHPRHIPTIRLSDGTVRITPADLAAWLERQDRRRLKAV